MLRLITPFDTTSIILLPGCRSITGRIGKVITSTVGTVSLSREDSFVPCTTRSRVTVASGRSLKQQLQEALNSTTYTPAVEGHHLHSRFGTLNQLPSCREVINRSPAQALAMRQNVRVLRIVVQKTKSTRSEHPFPWCLKVA